ncbi:MAG: hypothetical protein K5821_06480 [Nitrobacter sp.]|uniref:hypothetical protein n=1 Tax=Nitrobacter sp. TaxID=29420 RepID=UPI00263734A8|nr:hypothetical protein [Nitrobacter sp.]MCV0386063.1 hypothetical protein [Nitrobacter sp.]
MPRGQPTRFDTHGGIDLVEAQQQKLDQVFGITAQRTLPPFSKNGFFAECPHDHRAWRHRDYVDKILPPSHSVRKSKRQNGRFVHEILVGAIP